MPVMLPKTALMLSSAACLAAATAQPIIPGYDFIKASASYAGGMNFDDGGAEMELWQFNARTILTKPINPSESFVILPVIDYKATLMEIDTLDEDLHSISLSTFLVYSEKSSPWMIGGWLRAEYASDFERSTSDAFSFDVIAGAAYKFSDSLTIGLGGAVVNLNNDEEFYAGPVIDWRINECYRISLFGPNVVAAWTPDENWKVSLAGEASGDEWTVDAGFGENAVLDLDSYRIGLFVDRRLTGDLWLHVGGGVTVANSLEYKDVDGDRIAKDDLDEGWFAEIGLRMEIW
jgi:hypothetical protein